jgi:D-glucuronyl C5-epimerase-like protein
MLPLRRSGEKEEVLPDCRLAGFAPRTECKRVIRLESPLQLEYPDTLKAPYYSGLAQGQGISLLVRAHKESGDARHLDAVRAAFVSFRHPIEEGGVAFTDESGDLWFEEYIDSPHGHPQ